MHGVTNSRSGQFRQASATNNQQLNDYIGTAVITHGGDNNFHRVKYRYFNNSSPNFGRTFHCPETLPPGRRNTELKTGRVPTNPGRMATGYILRARVYSIYA